MCCGSSPALFWKIQSGVVEILEDQQGPTVNFITIFTDLELVEDIFKAHIVNIFSATSLTDTYSDCFTCS